MGYRLGAFQVVARWDHLDSDVGTPLGACAPKTATAPAGFASGGDLCRKYSSLTVGLNYDFIPESLHAAKLQLDYYRDHDEVRDVWANEVVLNAQVKF